MKRFEMLTRGDIKRIKDKEQQDLAKRVSELDNSLSTALEINDRYQRENKDLRDKGRAPQDRIKELEGKCREAGRAMIELNLTYEATLEENKKLKKRAQEAEGELTIIKGIETNRVKEYIEKNNDLLDELDELKKHVDPAHKIQKARESGL